MRRIVFLDFDGVLATPYHTTRLRHKGLPTRDEYGTRFCPLAVSNLIALCHLTGARIVVSSVWRRMGLSRLQAMFEMRGIDATIIGCTPDARGFRGSVTRGEEIAEWLRENPSDAYVILDDDMDMLPEQMPYFVHCPWDSGFAGSHLLEKALSIFNQTSSNP